MLHVRRFAPMKMKKANTNVSWEKAEAEAELAVVVVEVIVVMNLTFHKATDGDEEMLVVEDGDKVGICFLMVLDFLLLLLCQLLLHVSKMNLDSGFDDNGADSSEDPDSDPCSAFLFPAFN